MTSPRQPFSSPQDLPVELVKDSDNKWENFRNAAEQAGVHLPADPVFVSTLRTVFSFSDFIARSLTRRPELLPDLVESGDLERTYEKNEMAARVRNVFSGPSAPDSEAALCRTLRRLRIREMLRIAWRDLTFRAALQETMADLSNLAEACIDQALSFLYERQCLASGIPLGSDGSRQHLVVIGMGKLGGKELNFSSDVDLVFAYPYPGETDCADRPVSNDVFFSILCRQLIRAIGATTPDGFVFRVDMRLRPYGENGPIVTHFDAMEEYYQNQGREWERYAWIKARIVAGDKKSGESLLSRLRPFVYRKYLDYGAFESLRDMKQKISSEVARKGIRKNIKLGPGGIREIEFFGQMFQLIRGGVVSVLQEPSIQKVLSILSRENYIPAETCHELLEAYVFLRNTEHRLQEFSDQQTHTLPEDRVGKIRLAVSMGFADWASFETSLLRHMKNVHTHFEKLLGPEASEEAENPEQSLLNDLKKIWNVPDKYDKGPDVLSSAGFDDPEKAIIILNDLRHDPATRSLSAGGRTRLDKLVPLILNEAGRTEHPERVLNRIMDLVRTIEKRTNYLALLLENPDALVHLVRLAEASPWIVSFLARHPVMLDELLDPRTLYAPPRRPELEAEIRKRLGRIPPDDLESQMIELAIFRQAATLRVAAADVTGALPLMKVSDALSEIAETVLDNVLELSWNHLVRKHGTPTCIPKGEPCDRGFLIVAYGKLGGLELGYGSDLDLVFLHAGTEGQTEGSENPVDNPYFFSRVGQRIIHMLTTPSPAGILYETDMRLRPDGSSGILVVHIDAFSGYQEEKAWTWEHQALIKARPVCGDASLRNCFEDVRRRILARPRDKESLKEEVRRMRERMRKELLKPEPDVFDIKQDIGGLVDIEFLVQYLVLLNAHRHSGLTRWTDTVRLLQTLTQTGIMDSRTGTFLKEAYLAYRAAVHRLSLQEKPAKESERRFRSFRKEVLKIWENYMGSNR